MSNYNLISKPSASGLLNSPSTLPGIRFTEYWDCYKEHIEYAANFIGAMGRDGSSSMRMLSEFFNTIRVLLQLDSNKNVLVNASDPLGNTPLMEAAGNNDVAFARELIAQGADVEYYNEKSIGAPATALMQAAESDAAEVARLLIAHDAGVNTAHKINGMTPLMYAARSNAIETIELLITSGAKTEAKTFSIHGNNTALALAAKSGAAEAVTLLVKHGAKTKALRTVKKDLTPAMKKWLKLKGWLYPRGDG